MMGRKSNHYVLPNMSSVWDVTGKVVLSDELTKQCERIHFLV